MKRSFYFTLIVPFGLIMVLSSSIPAQTFPEKPISLILPFHAGGTPDIVGRALVEAVKKHLPKPVAVVNRPGGAGTIGISELYVSGGLP